MKIDEICIDRNMAMLTAEIASTAFENTEYEKGSEYSLMELAYLAGAAELAKRLKEDLNDE